MIIIKNRFDIKKFIPKENSLLIRISSFYPFTKITNIENYSKVLHFHFDDIKDVDLMNEFELKEIEDKLIQKSEALEIISVIKEMNFNDIVIHCDYGEGRSPAVGYAISEMINEFFDISSYKDYNRYVYKVIKENI